MRGRLGKGAPESSDGGESEGEQTGSAVMRSKVFRPRGALLPDQEISVALLTRAQKRGIRVIEMNSLQTKSRQRDGDLPCWGWSFSRLSLSRGIPRGTGRFSEAYFRLRLSLFSEGRA